MDVIPHNLLSEKMNIEKPWTQGLGNSHLLHIAANSGWRVNHLVHQELIENCCFPCVIETNQANLVFWQRERERFRSDVNSCWNHGLPSFPNRLQSLANISPILKPSVSPLLSLPGLPWPDLLPPQSSALQHMTSQHHVTRDPLWRPPAHSTAPSWLLQGNWYRRSNAFKAPPAAEIPAECQRARMHDLLRESSAGKLDMQFVRFFVQYHLGEQIIPKLLSNARERLTSLHTPRKSPARGTSWGLFFASVFRSDVSTPWRSSLVSFVSWKQRTFLRRLAQFRPLLVCLGKEKLK